MLKVSGVAPGRRGGLRIAMIGQKGLPAAVGGIEHHVEEIGRRLAARGHEVTAFTRASYGRSSGSTYAGIHLRPAPTVGSKRLDAIVHSASSTALALSSGYDIFHYHALGPGLVAPVPRLLSSAGVVLTVHGLDHQRAKWGGGARAVLGVAHWMSGHVPDRTIVVSQSLQQHYREVFGRECDYIPNGISRPGPAADGPVRDRGLAPGEYLLFVGRLVPEKGVDLLLRAYRGVPGGRRLVIVGDSSFTDAHVRVLQELAVADPRVLFTGAVLGPDLASLYAHAKAFVQPSLLEGLPLTLLEALSFGLPIVASDIGPHVEVLGSAPAPGRWLFGSGDVSSLQRALASALRGSDQDRAAAADLGEAMVARYDWDRVTDEVEQVYVELARRRSGARRWATARSRA
ncbi:MAG TPA: glycosyltransferase family 4 protein [Nocardioidaceae bacterium]|nr:glycosyltransferase family 4 protein [Nocardioidaceae bacterium]